jgi:putative cell wall-binding protein
MHGTKAAGVIGARADNGVGIAGVSYNAKILPVNVFKPETMSEGEFDPAHNSTDPRYRDDPKTNSVYWIRAYEYLLGLGLPELRVINMSLGGYTGFVANENAVINRAQSAGILTVCSAGNNTTDTLHYPSDYEGAVSVIALDTNASGRASFSNYGSEKDIAAPGQALQTTTQISTYTNDFKGTSAASPVVAGVAALLFAEDPTLGAERVKQILYESADDLGAPGKDDTFANGRVNAGAALGMITSGRWQRLGGSDRFGTMNAISRIRASSADTAIVVSADNYPDALCASSLAGIKDAPILLTHASPEYSLDKDTESEIIRLGVRDVIIIGGTPSVSEIAEADLRHLVSSKGGTVTRYGGDDRFKTADLLYSGNAGQFSHTAVIVSGRNYPDAISVSPYAYASTSPLFMVDGDGLLHDDTVGTIQGGSFDRVLLIGGVVSEGVKAQLGDSYAYVRLAGEDRYETNYKVVNWELGEGMGYEGLAVATGNNFPDALCGGALCGKYNAPVALVDTSANPSYTWLDALLSGKGALIGKGYVLGSSATISHAALDHIVEVTG